MASFSPMPPSAFLFVLTLTSVLHIGMIESKEIEFYNMADILKEVSVT